MTEHSLENYNFIKTIGEGTFGKVKLALHKPTREPVAIKILEKRKIKNKKDLERIEKEIKYMKILNHPNIVKIYEIIEDENNFYISMEYVSGGELFNYIVKNKRLDENEASFFYSQIIHIIQEIHKHKICHRDLKPENLLLTQNKTIKIIDFGLSNEYKYYLDTPCGSPCYASPEVIKGLKYSGLAIDLWASGIILYSMLCGYLPFDDKNNDVLFRKILKCKIEFPQRKNIVISENAKDLIKRILRPDPSKRISLEEILEHPFLSYGNKKYKERIKMDINKQDKLIIDYMVNVMRISNDNDIITKNIKNNRHNNLTTIFNLLKKKYNEGRLNYNILQKNETDSINRSKILKRFNYHKLNKTVNTDSNYNTNNNILVQDIGNIIKKKVNQNNNNIIIINNNNNLVNQPHKVNYILNSLFKEKKINSKNLLKKIDTSMSVEKAKKDTDSINVSQSPKIDSYRSNGFKYNSKIKEKKIFCKKYINTSLNQKNYLTHLNDSSIRKDSINVHTMNSSIEKNMDNTKSNETNNNNLINEYRKKLMPSSHLKTLTNLQFYTMNNNNKDKDNSIKIGLRNKSLIKSLMFNKKDSNKNLYESKGKNNNNYEKNIVQGSPDSRIYTKRINLFHNYTESAGNRSNYEQLNDMNKNTNYSLVSEIKTNLTKDNYNDSIRRSMNNTEEKNDLINTINFDNDIKNSFEYNDNRIIEKKIIKKGTKENFYKKLNLSKLRENRQKIRVNKAYKLQEKHNTINNIENNNNLSERGRLPRPMYFSKLMTNDNFNNNIESKRIQFRIKELTEKKKFNNSIAYSKKICSANKSFSKSNNTSNYLILSTNLNMYQISNRISKFCLENSLLYEQSNMIYTIIISKNNKFIIEMKFSEGSYILKFMHEIGDESQTKEYMSKLLCEIAK